jgi:hypothetical protein
MKNYRIYPKRIVDILRVNGRRQNVKIFDKSYIRICITHITRLGRNGSVNIFLKRVWRKNHYD